MLMRINQSKQEVNRRKTNGVTRLVLRPVEHMKTTRLLQPTGEEDRKFSVQSEGSAVLEVTVAGAGPAAVWQWWTLGTGCGRLAKGRMPP